MSAAPANRDEELLALLAERDVSAACKVHDKLMAAEESAEIAELSRAYARLSRSARQTLACKSKLAREHAQHQAWLDRGRPPPEDPEIEDELSAVDTRIAELQDVVGRMVYAVHIDSPKAAEKLDRFDRELDDWVEKPDFLDDDFEAQVFRAARLLDLPENLERIWRVLKRPPGSPDPVGRCAKPPPQVVWPNAIKPPRHDSS